MTSPSQSTRWVEECPQTGTREGMVLFRDFSVPPKPLAVPGAIDIDDLVAEFESQSPENVEAIAQGRQWVAKTFYAHQSSLAQLRLQRGWSQAELSKQAKTSQSYIARLELGRTDPQISTARKIAVALGVSIEVFANALLSEGEV